MSLGGGNQIDINLEEEFLSESPRDNVTEAMTSQVIRFLFRNAIVARVRSEPRVLRILLEAAVLASVVAILSSTYVGLPLSLCFWAVLALFAEALFQVHFAEAYQLYNAWTTFRRQAYLTVAAFFLARLAVGYILGIPTPADVYADILAHGGLTETFWNHPVPDAVLFEVLLDIPLVFVSMAAVVKRSKKALTFFSVLAVVFAVMTALPLTRSAFHECIPAHGLLPCTWKLLFTGFER